MNPPPLWAHPDTTIGTLPGPGPQEICNASLSVAQKDRVGSPSDCLMAISSLEYRSYGNVAIHRRIGFFPLVLCVCLLASSEIGMTRETQPERILRMRTVLERTGLSRSTVYRKMQEGTFPPKIKLSEHCCGWRESELNRWITDPLAYGR